MFYGRNSFKKDRSGIAYHIEMDITGGACGIEAGAWDSKTVPAVARPCYEDCADHDRRFGWQTMKGEKMDKKTFEESLIRLFPESGGEAVKHWFSFAEECIEMGQSPDFALVSGKDAAIGKWLDAIYKGICRVKQQYGEKPAELVCGLSVKHCLYPWEMMEAAKFLKNGGDIDGVVLQSVEGLLDEYDAGREAHAPEERAETEKEVGDMWMLKFYKAYAKNKRLKRMLAYRGRMQ